MEGHNIIVMNTATMIEALEYYLNNKVFGVGAKVHVESVKTNQRDVAPTYNVSIQPQKDTEDE